MSRSFDERIVYQCKLHWGIFLWPLFSAFPPTALALAYLWMIYGMFNRLGPVGQNIHFPWFLLLLPGLIVGLMSFLAVLIKYLKSEVVLTETRLKFSTGWLSIGSTEILLSRIETLTLWEPLVGRLVGYGTVSVTGTGGTVFTLRFLPKPEDFHDLLQTMSNPRQSGPTPKRENVSEQLADIHSRYMPKE